MIVGRTRPVVVKALKRIFRLQRLAVDQSGKPEGENAARMVAATAASSGLRLTASDLELRTSEPYPIENPWDADVARVVAEATTATLEIRAATSTFVFSGLGVAVDEADRQYMAHSKVMARAIHSFIAGHFIGSFGLNTFMAAAESHSQSSTLQGAAHEAQSEEEGSDADFDIEVMRIAVKGARELDPVWGDLVRRSARG